MLVDIKASNVTVFNELDFTMVGLKSRKKKPDTVLNINGWLLGKVSLIYGENGSGKSTFIRILSVLRSIVLADVDTIAAYNQLAYDKSKLIKINITFIASGMLYSYTIELDSNVILAEALFFRKVAFKGRDSRIFEREWNGERYSWKFGKEFKGNKRLLNENNINVFSSMILGYKDEIFHLSNAYAWFDHVVIAEKYDWSRLTHSIFYAETFAPKYMEFMLKALHFAGMNISALKYDSNTNQAMAQTGNGTWIPISDLSTGEQNYLALMIQVYKAKEVIIIDDFGQGLHPRLSKKLLELIHETFGKQIIATTHDVTLIEDVTLIKSNIRREQIWFADKARGKTEMVSLADYVDGTCSIGRYLVGRYGGVPFIRETAFWGYNEH